MQRILILGNSGSGKSTFAADLGKAIGIPVIHLDAYFWSSGWVEPQRDFWQEQVSTLLAGNSWIMDGNYQKTLPQRLQRADTVIYLDFPRYICFLRIFKRLLMYWRKSRPDIAPGCREKVDLSFIRWIWNFPRTVKPKVFGNISKQDHPLDLFVFKKRLEVDQFFRQFEYSKNHN